MNTEFAQFLHDMSRESLVPKMLSGTTVWVEKEDDKWAFHLVEKEDVYDRALLSGNWEALIYDRLLTQYEKYLIETKIMKKYLL